MSENIPKTAEEFDRRFDEGEDIFSLGMDPSKGTQPGLEQRPIDVNLPNYLLNKIDRQAEIHGITRQDLIERWLRACVEAESGNDR